MSTTEKLTLSGGCYCGKLRYELSLNSKDEARTSLCHCGNCKKAFGGVFGVTVKVPVAGFKYRDTGEKAKVCGVSFFMLGWVVERRVGERRIEVDVVIKGGELGFGIIVNCGVVLMTHADPRTRQRLRHEFVPGVLFELRFLYLRVWGMLPLDFSTISLSSDIRTSFIYFLAVLDCNWSVPNTTLRNQQNRTSAI